MFTMKVLVRDGDVERAIRMLKRKMVKEGVMRELKQRTHFEKPSEEKRRRHAAAVRRARRAAKRKEDSEA